LAIRRIQNRQAARVLEYLTATTPASAPSAVEEFKATATALQTSDKAIAVELAAMKSQDQTRHLISTIATRVGAVLILVFLVQILITLYKYNTRLANYYEARADAIELSIDEQGNILDTQLSRLLAVLAPDSITFEKDPEAPSQQAIEIVKSVLAGQRQQISSADKPVPPPNA
jgi:hypothetical protein